jgi:hydroxyacylglutathione hydrolase
MAQEITPITLTSFIGDVNCYLAKTGVDDFVLIDTGLAVSRKALVSQLRNAGCTPGHLKLIVLTHSDFDHVGNAAYLHQEYAAKIGMHPLEIPSVETGHMGLSRKTKTLMSRILFSIYRMRKASRFKPDIELTDDTDLETFGYNARILHVPGHSIGSIGILTASGDFFCGDLMTNREKPALNPLIDELSVAQDSLTRLKSKDIQTVYPGHGKPFFFKDLTW